MINATVSQPDQPAPLSHNPTSMKEIRAADPGHAEARLNLATLHLRMADTLLGLGREEDAARHFEAALEARPDLEEARRGLGRLRAGGRQEGAAE